VPAVVVSPWIERGSVFGWRAADPGKRVTFDHTSILATVAAMTGVQVPSRRARAAAGLGVTLDRTTPRNDCPPRLVYDASAYRRSGVDPERPDASTPDAASAPGNPSEPADTGVAGELLDAWRAEHGAGATASDLVEHYRSLLGSPEGPRG
jgi:hypothetical protein